MWKIEEVAVLAFLVAGAVYDFRKRKIPAGYLMLGTVGIVLYLAFEGRMEWYLWLPGMATGLLFVVCSKITEEGIGYGDSWMILNLGLFLGIWRLLISLGIAFTAAAAAAGFGLMLKKWNRKTRIPFYPFLVIGYVGALLW